MSRRRGSIRFLGDWSDYFTRKRDVVFISEWAPRLYKHFGRVLKNTNKPQSGCAEHYAAWLDRQLKKGCEFEVIKLHFQREHICSLNGEAVEFRAGIEYEVPTELVKYFVPSGIAVIAGGPDAKPRKLSGKKVKIKMLFTQKSALFDGINISEFKAGKVYTLPKFQADGFIAAGWAEQLEEGAKKEE